MLNRLRVLTRRGHFVYSCNIVFNYMGGEHSAKYAEMFDDEGFGGAWLRHMIGDGSDLEHYAYREMMLALYCEVEGIK